VWRATPGLELVVEVVLYPLVVEARRAVRDAQQTLYRTQIAEAKALMREIDPRPHDTLVRRFQEL
jgi:hypothetical protein